MVKTPRLLGPDLLRSIAILLILLANSLYILQSENSVVEIIAQKAGFLGLEFFLVLSGFLLAVNFYPIFLNVNFRSGDALHFIKARMFRILPLYYLILAVNLLLALFVDYSPEEVWSYFLFVQNFASPIPAFFPESWGIPVIIFSAVVFPLLLSGFSAADQKSKKVIFAVVTLVLIAIFLWTKWLHHNAINISDQIKWEVFVKTVTIYRFDSLFIGTFFGWIFMTRPRFVKINALAIGVTGIFATAFLLFGMDYFAITVGTHPAFYAICYLPLHSLAIGLLLLSLGGFKPQYATYSAVIVTLSNSAYAIFLVHFSIVLLLFEHLVIENVTSSNILILLSVAYFLISVLSGILITKLFNGLRNRNRRLI